MLTGRSRVTSDAFYTKPEVAERCIHVVSQLFDLVEFDLVIEPSAGSGAFSSVLSRYPAPVLAYDINPHAEGVVTQDFLELDTDALCRGKRVMVVGNPPFGRQSCLAKRFIKKCATFAEVIAFILPRSFKKESQAAAVPSDFHRVHEEDLADDSFTIGGKEYPVPCVFQVWRRLHGQNREVAAKQAPAGYSFVKLDEHPDYALRRVGVYAGAISVTSTDKSPQSHYFIKLEEGVDKATFERRYRAISFAHNNTVGPRSVSKQDFIRALNSIHLSDHPHNNPYSTPKA